MDERYIIIGRSSCPFCIMAQDVLVAKGGQYIFLDYEEDRQILEEYKVFHNQETVPIVLSNNLKTGMVKQVGGYTDLLEHIGV
ncbi:MAG: hypothetical protein CMF52_06645 [Legionellales bacterium]|nr:hypothetical protein [Legionellales bacterium]|tara:strand:- start:1541 stop:1789 length:249 start_codon:yes stop_codon:yes gene_type:complete